jgi:hypothetical protein
MEQLKLFGHEKSSESSETPCQINSIRPLYHGNMEGYIRAPDPSIR